MQHYTFRLTPEGRAFMATIFRHGAGRSWGSQRQPEATGVVNPGACIKEDSFWHVFDDKRTDSIVSHYDAGQYAAGLDSIGNLTAKIFHPP